MSDDFFALPAFEPADALIGLKRQLRDLRPLVERGSSFTLRGQPVIELETAETTIVARLAKRPAQTPEWQTHTLKASADLRRFVDTVKQHMARWSDE
jgi:hypothetical protein